MRFARSSFSNRFAIEKPYHVVPVKHSRRLFGELTSRLTFPPSFPTFFRFVPFSQRLSFQIFHVVVDERARTSEPFSCGGFNRRFFGRGNVPFDPRGKLGNNVPENSQLITVRYTIFTVLGGRASWL